MVNRLIFEVNEALKHELYMAALCTVLTIPDMCAKAEYPNLKTSDRYKKWFDEHIGRYEKSDDDAEGMPYLSGEVVYQLRCSLLHQGTPNIDKDRIQETCCKIDKFVIYVEKTKDIPIYSDCALIHRSGYNGNFTKTEREYTVNVQRLCLLITRAARKYYYENRDKFGFLNFTIQDWDKMVENHNKNRGD